MHIDPLIADALCPEDLRGRIATPPPGPVARSLVARLARAEAPAAHTLGHAVAAAGDGGGAETPIVWERAEGALVWDVDGNRYLDLAAGFGALPLGHQHPRVVAATQAQAAKL